MKKRFEKEYQKYCQKISGFKSRELRQSEGDMCLGAVSMVYDLGLIDDSELQELTSKVFTLVYGCKEPEEK